MSAYFYFEIQADDLARAAHFYNKIFGWQFTKAPGMLVEYQRIVTGGPRGGLLKRPAQTPPTGYGTNAFVCSVEVASFDETARQIMDFGVQVALPKFAVPGTCWQGYFIDTEGNTFGIFEVDEEAK